MIRIVCQGRDFGPDGNLLCTVMKTFDGQWDELEAWLRDNRNYDGRTVLGAELLPITLEAHRAEEPSGD